MSDTTQKQTVQKQANGASPKPKPQNNKNTSTNVSNDGFKSVGKPRNQQNGANGSQKPNKDNANKPKGNNNNNNNTQQRRRKEGGNNNNNNKPKQQQANPQQAPSTPTLKGKIPAEHYELVLEVVRGTGGYFSEQEAWATLQTNSHNVKNTIEVLNRKCSFNAFIFQKFILSCFIFTSTVSHYPQFIFPFFKFSLDKIKKRRSRALN